MKPTLILLLALAALVLTGCTLVPTDMFPKLTWYWSADAKAYREQQRQEKIYEQQSTNSVPAK